MRSLLLLLFLAINFLVVVLAKDGDSIPERTFLEEMDLNKDGFISLKEFLWSKIPSEFAERRRNFKKFDVNKDGRLNEAEFVKASLDDYRRFNKEGYLRQFKATDTDHDGELSLKEFSKLQNQRYGTYKGKTEHYVFDEFLFVDSNDDDAISPEEFRTGWNDMYSIKHTDDERTSAR